MPTNIFLVYFILAMQKNFFSQVQSGVEGISYTPVVDTGSRQTQLPVKQTTRVFVGANPTPPTIKEIVLPIDGGTDICDKDGFCD